MIKTKVQHQVLASIRKLSKLGYGPTVREIAADIGRSGVSTTHKALTDLRASGVIEWIPGVHRSIEIISEGPATEQLVRLPTPELLRVAADVQAEIGRRSARGRLVA